MTGDQRPILFVGDVQGCAAELAALLERAAFRPGTHRLVPVGDTVNRGPDAPGVIRLLREAQAEPIQGNHELHLLHLAASDPGERDWRRRSRSAFLQLEAAGMLDEVLAWIRTWPLYREGPDWIAVHAGLHPQLPPGRTPVAFLVGVRFCTERGERPPGPDGQLQAPPPGYHPWHALYRGTRTVIFGHWARQGLLVADRLRGLDTGCVYGGQLTGLWWPADTLVQVPSQQPYRRLPETAQRSSA